MKKYLCLPALLLALCAGAQQKEGRIVYERVMQMPVPQIQNMDPELARQIPRSRTDQFELLFANNQLLWQFLPSSENDGGDQTFAGNGRVFRFGGTANEVGFVDLEKGTRVDQKDIFEKTYLVSDSLKKWDWKLSDETKTILNHTCNKATTTRVVTRMQMTMENGEMKRSPISDTSVVTVWYTTDIPVAVGPEFVGQLPGAILEVEYAKGMTSYKAIEISPKVNASKIKAPKDGKKLTAAEFSKERDKLMEEMRKNMPAGGGMQIRTLN